MYHVGQVEISPWAVMCGVKTNRELRIKISDMSFVWNRDEWCSGGLYYSCTGCSLVGIEVACVLGGAAAGSFNYWIFSQQCQF